MEEFEQIGPFQIELDPPATGGVGYAEGQALNDLCAALATWDNGGAPPAGVIEAGLQVAGQCALQLQSGWGGAGDSAWTASLRQLQDGTSVLALTSGADALGFLFDTTGNCYSGTWSSQFTGRAMTFALGPGGLYNHTGACVPMPDAPPGWTTTPMMPFATAEEGGLLGGFGSGALFGAGAAALGGLLSAALQAQRKPLSRQPPVAQPPSPAAGFSAPTQSDARPALAHPGPAQQPPSQPQASAPPAPQTRLASPADFTRPAGPLPYPQVQAPPHRPPPPGDSWSITIQNGPDAGRTIPLQGTMRIGRVNPCEIVLADELASRVHAEITVTPQGCVIQDCNSTNGTMVNGVRITGPVALRGGNLLQCGRTEMLVGAPAEADSEKTLIMDAGQLTQAFRPFEAQAPAAEPFVTAPPPVAKPPEPAPRAAAGTVFCPACGSAVAGSPKFCGRCGASLS